MRQSGVLAAACLYALDNNIERLADDHARAEKLANGLAQTPLKIVDDAAQTNMVFIAMPDDSDRDFDALRAHAKQHDLLLAERAGEVLRLVVHKDIGDGDVDKAVGIIAEFFGR